MNIYRRNLKLIYYKTAEVSFYSNKFLSLNCPKRLEAINILLHKFVDTGSIYYYLQQFIHSLYYFTLRVQSIFLKYTFITIGKQINKQLEIYKLNKDISPIESATTG